MRENAFQYLESIVPRDEYLNVEILCAKQSRLIIKLEEGIRMWYRERKHTRTKAAGILKHFLRARQTTHQ